MSEQRNSVELKFSNFLHPLHCHNFLSEKALTFVLATSLVDVITELVLSLYGQKSVHDGGRENERSTEFSVLGEF